MERSDKGDGVDDGVGDGAGDGNDNDSGIGDGDGDGPKQRAFLEDMKSILFQT